AACVPISLTWLWGCCSDLAHKDTKVSAMVADISFPAGLPDFRGRVRANFYCQWICGDNGLSRAPAESQQRRRGGLAQPGFGRFRRQGARRGRDETPRGAAAKKQDL